MFTEKESELAAVFHRYLLTKHDRVRMEVCDTDLVGYGPKNVLTGYELKVKDWKRLFRQMYYNRLYYDEVYGVMPKKYSHLAKRNWDKAPSGSGLYEIDMQTEEVFLVFSHAPVDYIWPIKKLRLYRMFATCLGRAPYR